MERTLTLTRILDAPRELVFEAWTDPTQLDWFYSGNGAVTEPIQLDLNVGGEWRQQMIIDEDTQYITGGVYLEIEPPERLVYRFGAVGGWPDLALEPDGPIITVQLNELAGSTEMLVTVSFPDGVTDERVQEWFDTGIKDGMGQTIDRLVDRFRA